MACNGCTKRFGFFLKEMGCPSCKYSFCSKCLRFRIKVEGKSKEVCLRCYELCKSGVDFNDSKTRSSKPSSTSILDVPVQENSLSKNIINPLTQPTETDKDAEIKKRLAALKQKDGNDDQSEPEISSATAGTSLTDMEKRLAALKGIEYKDYTEANKKFLIQKDGRSEEEQIRDILKQFAEEQEIHHSMDSYRLAAVDDIEQRLAALKDTPADSSSTTQGPNLVKTVGDQCLPDSSDDEGGERDVEAAKNLAARFMEEAAIDAKKHPMDDDDLNDLEIPTPLDPSETEELPWCTICNEDAAIRCVSCGGDLFCRGCFKECHDDDEDYRKHETKAFKAIVDKNKS
ncbi:abscission/NoCut checkpoint regulator isoform X2 [Armigeres subalbatus]|uniref:abscission/NoCut checkpoint regulator isoform X2 n=1 Tax=Armigeres subalbatus TaxID=124917 RepID=UPI002ED502FE